MEITLEWLREKGASQKAVELYDGERRVFVHCLIADLLRDGRSELANLLLIARLDDEQLIRYTIYVADRVEECGYEDKFPSFARLRLAIDAARAYRDWPHSRELLCSPRTLVLTITRILWELSYVRVVNAEAACPTRDAVCHVIQGAKAVYEKNDADWNTALKDVVEFGLALLEEVA